jgi:ketosteroid isomerase-like protein
MKRMMLALLLAGCSAATQQSSEAAIREAEGRLADAFTRQDVNAIDGLWSDDFVFTAPNGNVFTKQQRLTGMKPIPAGTKPTLINRNDSVVVRVYGNAAVATVLSSWQMTGASVSDQYQATHVWVKQRGRWRMVAAQVSQIKRPQS